MTSKSCRALALIIQTATLVAFVILVATGCAIVDNTEEGISDDVTIRSSGTHLVVHNGTEARVYYFAVGRQLSALIDWIPHLDEALSIAPGTSATIPYDDIMMDSEAGETQVIVYWWKATIRDGKRVPGGITSAIVDL